MKKYKMLVLAFLVISVFTINTYAIPETVYCEEDLFMMWISCDDGNIFANFGQADNYYTVEHIPQYEETNPFQTFKLGGTTETFS